MVQGGAQSELKQTLGTTHNNGLQWETADQENQDPFSLVDDASTPRAAKRCNLL